MRPPLDVWYASPTEVIRIHILKPHIHTNRERERERFFKAVPWAHSSSGTTSIVGIHVDDLTVSARRSGSAAPGPAARLRQPPVPRVGAEAQWRRCPDKTRGP